MRIIISPNPDARPRVLVINPNSSEGFSEAMHSSLGGIVPGLELDFYTAPTHAPKSIEGSYDGVVTAAAVVEELEEKLGGWNGFVVACFSAHPLVHALRELTRSPVVGIMDSSLLFASTLGSRIGILTTSARWEPLLTHDAHALHLSSLNSAGVVSSGLSVLDLEHLPRDEVLHTLGKIAKEELKEKRSADVIVLGCAGMVGLDDAVKTACGEGMTVVDPVRAGVEMCAGLVRMGLKTGTGGIYAPMKKAS